MSEVKLEVRKIGKVTGWGKHTPEKVWLLKCLSQLAPNCEIFKKDYSPDHPVNDIEEMFKVPRGFLD
jgi:hypothetical protein